MGCFLNMLTAGLLWDFNSVFNLTLAELESLFLLFVSIFWKQMYSGED